jgi:fructokinase
VTLRIGVDLGGTKTEAVVVQLGGDEPKVIARKRVPTERDRGYEHIVDATRALVVDVAKEAGISTLPDVGVGMPGSVSRRTGEELVKNSNTTVLNGRPFRSDLARALAVNVKFANDANCFALAEATWGAARDARVAFGVILGTGVGGGVVLDRKAWDGAQGIAGEWGHIVLDPTNGPECYCGRRGCVETYLSGPAIERAYRERTGKDARLPEIARAEDGRELVAERVDVFGRALATVIDVIDPDVVVLGGGVSNLDVFYDEGPKAVARWVFNDMLETRIVKNALGDSAGVLGAALL